MTLVHSPSAHPHRADAAAGSRLSTAARDSGAGEQSSAAEAGGFYARVENGRLFLRDCNRMVPASGWDATLILLMLDGSPHPESQERARQIKAALKETMQ